MSETHQETLKTPSYSASVDATKRGPKKKNTYTLWLILIVSILPIVSAYFVYFTGIGMPRNTVNKGQILATAVSLRPLLPDETWQDLNQDKKWHLLLPLSNSCFDENSACGKGLFTTRQVHIRLAQKSGRLDRMAFVNDDAISDVQMNELKKNHPQLRIINAPVEDGRAEVWQAWRKGIDLPGRDDEYFLVDQEGRAMMVYSSEHHGNDLLKDIKRALKSSIDYQ